MPVQDHEREIEKLEKELSVLKERKAKASTEADEWTEKRDRLNVQAKDFRSKVHKLKATRDGMNQKVQELKLLRDSIGDEIHHSRAQLRSLRQKAIALADREPREDLETLERKLNQIEWSIQTESLSLQEEKELVDCVRQLQAQIDVHKKIEVNRQEMLELQAELKAAETRRASHHKELISMADRSQEVHTEISENVEKLKELQAEATKAHENFLRAKDRANVVREKITSTIARIQVLRKEIQKREELAKSTKQDAMRERTREQAKAKLDRGEKLTWHEFQIVTDEGETTQD